MRVMKTRTQQVDYTDKLICDKCFQEIRTSGYDAFNCELKYKTDHSYPEYGNGELKTLDLCSNCADVLMNLLGENGYNVQCKDWKY